MLSNFSNASDSGYVLLYTYSTSVSFGFISAAKNTNTGETLNLEMAVATNILNANSGTYRDMKSGAVMLIGDAVDQGLVEIEYDTDSTGKLPARFV